MAIFDGVKPNTLWALAAIDVGIFTVLCLGSALYGSYYAHDHELESAPMLWDFYAYSLLRILRIWGYRFVSLISMFGTFLHIAFVSESRWAQTNCYVFTFIFCILTILPTSFLRSPVSRLSQREAHVEFQDEEDRGETVQSSNDQNDVLEEENYNFENETSAETERRLKRHWTRLFSIGGPEKNHLAIGCAALLVRLPCSLAVPHYVSVLIMTTAGAGIHDPYFTYYVVVLCVTGIIDSVLDFFCVFLFARVQQRIVRALRSNVYRNVLMQEIAFFDVMKHGDLTSRLNADINEMANDLSWVFRFTIESIVRVGGITIYMIIFAPRLAAVALTLIPLNSFLSKIYSKWIRKNQAQVQLALADSNAHSSEALNGIRTVKTFGGEDFEHSRYYACNQRYYELNVKQNMITATYYSVIYTFLMNFVVQTSLVCFGVYLETPSNTLIAFMFYRGMLQEWVSNLLNSYTQMMKGMGASQRVFFLLERKPRVSPTGEKEATPSPNLLFDRVAFEYRTRKNVQVLKSISFEVQPGELIAIVGRSGSGKSTIFHLLLNLYEPTGGQITMDDIPIHQLPRKFLLSKISIVAQEPLLFSGSILQNIQYNGTFTLEKCMQAAKDANAMDFISLLPNGINTEVGEKGVQLSGGQKQRIAIARALVRKPAILLLDEATSSLDSESEAIVQAALEKAMKGRTTLVIAHRLSTVRDAGTIIVLDKGTLVEKGNHDSLMEQGGIYKKLVDNQILGDGKIKDEPVLNDEVRSSSENPNNPLFWKEPEILEKVSRVEEENWEEPEDNDEKVSRVDEENWEEPEDNDEKVSRVEEEDGEESEDNDEKEKK